MKILALLFILLTFTIAKVLINEEASAGPTITFPTLTPPDIEFQDPNFADCENGITDCLFLIAQILFNVAAGVIFIILFIISLLVYLFELFILIISVSFTPIVGAPWWINGIFQLIFGGALAFILWRLIRSGESDA